jgi:SAM-dependent methyltransferase
MYYKRDFWSNENLKFATPHYRLKKCAGLVNEIAGDRPCDLLDVGCGPGALQGLLRENISYFGIDIAIPEPAPNLIESDLLESPISFHRKKFDIIVAQGFFEYLGEFQEQKFMEINDLLKEDGRFVATYVNFHHRAPSIYWPYSNIQPPGAFRASLARYLTVEKYFPTSHNWRHSEPGRPLIQAMQVPIRLPVISRYLAVEYFFICSRGPQRSGQVDPQIQHWAGTMAPARRASAKLRVPAASTAAGGRAVRLGHPLGRRPRALAARAEPACAERVLPQDARLTRPRQFARQGSDAVVRCPMGLRIG